MRRAFEHGQDLFVEVVEQLGANANIYKTISPILEKTCTYFCFGCAFIYEADHTQTLYLKENFAFYECASLPVSLRLEEHFSGEEIAQLMKMPIMFSLADGEQSDLGCRLSKLFSASSLLLVPIMDKRDALIGLVGMVDRRSEITLSEGDLTVARSVLAVVSNHIKLRVYQRKVEFAQKSMESIMDNMGIDIYVNDFDTHEILYINKSMAASYGGLANLVGKPCWKALYHDDRIGECEYCPRKHLIDEQGNPTKAYSWDYERPFDKAWFRVLSAAFRWVDGRTAIVVSSFDITENKKNEFLIERMAFYDSLTQLKNRRKFELDFTTSIENVTSQGLESYVLFLDLDNFKMINDQFGHAVGDDLLTAVAAFMLIEPSVTGHAYRYGGDEFVLFYENVTRQEIDEIIARINARFAQPWLLGERELDCNASIGLACYPKEGEDYDTLLRAADRAMYHEKSKRKKYDDWII